MSLTLPANFKRDIQPRDTNLVPIVVIGNHREDPSNWIYLSTNSLSLKYNIVAFGDSAVTWNFKPLLLNIPFLKKALTLKNANIKYLQ